ncbi:restriction system protein [Variovorax boronicumulans]|uniref:restriction endonuclease n=1 Tax=Variovorax boronicumulans TaxID=436515 RepID=UPI002785A0DE|nr:restriction endonuclease [Variovorax boronicumulans]MDQ0012005.1 restriction system protein [Variovorax boronicumulans]
MSGIFLPRDLFVAYISEQIGFKSGLALSLDELISHTDIKSKLHTQLSSAEATHVSIHHHELLDSFQMILHRLGVLPHPVAYHAPTFFRFSPRNDAIRQSVIEGVFDLLAGEKDWLLPKPGLELSQFLRNAEERWGYLGQELAKEIVDMMYLYRIGSLCEFDRFRRIDWNGTIELKELFSSESLDAPNGHFIDQRFLDYLGANFSAIDTMNWRKFEGLSGEFFSRAGYDVEMGPGRGDGGVDIRVWKPKINKNGNPPTILIQCKRQKSSIEQVIVKALWADVVHEGAESGLIVTSSRIAPGSQRLCSARSYPVRVEERASLARWLKALRTPGSGILTSI